MVRPQLTQSTLASSIQPPAPYGRSNGTKSSSESPAFILVLVDGGSAPFSNGLISQGKSGGQQAANQVRYERRCGGGGGEKLTSRVCRWEVEKDLRGASFTLPPNDDRMFDFSRLAAFDVELDFEKGSSETIEVLTFVFCSKAALVSSLLKAQVISRSVVRSRDRDAFPTNDATPVELRGRPSPSPSTPPPFAQ